MFGFCIILLFLTACYAVTSIWLHIGVLRLKKGRAKGIAYASSSGSGIAKQDEGDAELPFVSILVAARNEEKNITKCLESLVRQQYPYDKYEIVIINDRSTDGTLTIIKEFQEKHKVVRYVSLHSNLSGLTGKQNALNEGLKLCTGEIILNTDADCVAEPLWIRRTVLRFTPEIDFAVGFSMTVDMGGSKSFFSNLQSLDMLFLMDAAAGAVGMGCPISGLGTNLAYRKAVTNYIDYRKMGYTITEDASIIQAVARNPSYGVGVIYDKDAAVSTSPEDSVKQFLFQRIRWILGGRVTRPWVQALLHLIFLFHLCLVVSLPLMFFARSLVFFALLSFLVKISLDFARCYRVCREFGRADLLRSFALYELFMISYSIFAGLGSIFVKKVRWKGEVCARGTSSMNSV